MAAAVVLLSGTAFAASSFDVACDARKGIDATKTTLGDLDISVVDLNTRDDAGIDDADLYVDDGEARTPILNLGPRVATIARDVFENAGDETGDETRSVRESTIAPLAGSSGQDRRPDALEADDESADSGNHSPLHIYRKMYRTDI